MKVIIRREDGVTGAGEVVAVIGGPHELQGVVDSITYWGGMYRPERGDSVKDMTAQLVWDEESGDCYAELIVEAPNE